MQIVSVRVHIDERSTRWVPCEYTTVHFVIVSVVDVTVVAGLSSSLLCYEKTIAAKCVKHTVCVYSSCFYTEIHSFRWILCMRKESHTTIVSAQTAIQYACQWIASTFILCIVFSLFLDEHEATNVQRTSRKSIWTKLFALFFSGGIYIYRLNISAHSFARCHIFSSESLGDSAIQQHIQNKHNNI